jgi:hypothetical protein
MPSRYETKIVNYALNVLRSAGASKGVVIDEKMAVRLALRVLLEHLTSTPSPVEFWTIYENPAFPTWPACRASYEMIVKQMERAGFTIDAENIHPVAGD